MRIGELAAQAGVSVRSLRYYEQQQLLSCQRSPSDQRHYPESAAGRVQLIQQLFGAGLTSRMIRELLPCFETGEVTPELLGRLTAERNRIDKQATSLAQARDRLDAIIDVATTAERQDQPACWATRRRSNGDLPHPSTADADSRGLPTR